MSYITVGAAWKKEGKNGTLLSFSLDTAKIAQCQADAKGKISATLYKNDKKTKANQPDYNLTVKADNVQSENQPPDTSDPVKDDLPF